MIKWRLVFYSAIVCFVISILIRMVVYDESLAENVVRSLFLAVVLTAVMIPVEMKFFRKMSHKLTESIPPVELSVDEKLILESVASHYMGKEAVGGKLALTDKRLIFQSHKLNVQNHKSEFPVSDIKLAQMEPNKLTDKIFKLELKNNQVHKFLVDSPSQWVNALTHS
jgi:hypothetical protein